MRTLKALPTIRLSETTFESPTRLREEDLKTGDVTVRISRETQLESCEPEHSEVGDRFRQIEEASVRISSCQKRGVHHDLLSVAADVAPFALRIVEPDRDSAAAKLGSDSSN